MLPQTFHPVIRKWFAETYGEPTSVQAESWPLIERGENVLALAPTGSGKTLTAFLSAISRFCPTEREGSAYDAKKLSVLYVSPLKALNEDIKRNLLIPLAAIKTRFEKEGLPFPPIRVQTRSGDTPQTERRKFFTSPPSILVTTPESLAILLLNAKGRQVLSNIKYLIIDEIHALLGNKRGAYLSCQIERLAAVAGEFQRISLSATVRNPQIAAQFAGGIGRQVHIVSPVSEKKIDFSVEYPNLEENDIDEISILGREGSRYTPLINYVLNRIWEGSTLLVFTDSRRRAERLSHYLNLQAAEIFARNGAPAGRSFTGAVSFPHHGSLSKELRRGVEKGLAEGRLGCVVATSSLELGIDVGSVDEVVLAGSGGNVSQALQRIGRAGHSVGQVSKGKLFALHGMDLLLATALKDAVDERDIEEVRPIENPLDILAQVILALCVEKERGIDELYETIKKFYIFKNLNRDSYLRVVYMLAGLVSKGNPLQKTGGELSRLRELKPRIWLDKIEWKIGAIDGTVKLLYSSGGVIANRGLYSLRLADGTKIGELDEEFVWERTTGDCFDFGARGWRITSISSESVEVIPLDYRADFIPFWKSDTFFRSGNLTERLLELLDNYNKTSGFNSRLNTQARDSLKNLLNAQLCAQRGIPLSDRKNIAVEIIKNNEHNRDFVSIVFHSFRGGRVNYPLSLALSLELEEAVNLRVESFSGDDSILFLMPRQGLHDGAGLYGRTELSGVCGLDKNISKDVEEIFRRAIEALGNSTQGGITRGERLFRNRLESSGVFGASFREAAERSLLLPKAQFGKRTPLWIMRQRSKRLFDAVCGEDGFPATAEAWRSCLVDTFDMEGFRSLLAAISDKSVTLSFFQTEIPSPFSREVVRQETNAFMYEYDERKDLGSRSATLSDKVIEEAIGSAALRPALKQPVVDSFVSRLRREIAGYAPEDALSLSEWVKERIAIPLDEWETLRTAMPQAIANEACQSSFDCGGKILTVTRNSTAIPSVVHREWEETWKAEPLSLLGQWLRYEGPVCVERICAVFGAGETEVKDAIAALVEIDEAVSDVQITQDAPSPLSTPHSLLLISRSLQICDRENLEMLLRLSRKKERPVIKERPASALVPFLALRQGLTANNTNANCADANCAVFRKNLYAWTAPAKLWETELFCARNISYNSEIIDREIREGRLVWYGAGKERIGFCRGEDLDLVFDLQDNEKSHNSKISHNGGKSSNNGNSHNTGQSEKIAQLAASSFFNRPRDFWEIKNELIMDSRSCAEALWREVWKGSLTSDSFKPVRKGVEAGFIPKEIEFSKPEQTVPFGRQRRIPGALKNRWKGGAPVSGNWFSLVTDEQAEYSPLEEDAVNRDRVRLLLDRFGVLCRPLLEREAPVFSWSRLLPAMRRMELAGELTAGRFFAGINSLQFASPSIAAELEQAEGNSRIYWMNAADPASPAGIEIDGLGYSLCARSANNRLYYRGAGLIAISYRNGKELQIFIEADDSDMAQLIALFKIPRTRAVLPEKKLTVEKINGQDAAGSGCAKVFKANGFISDRGKLIFW